MGLMDRVKAQAAQIAQQAQEVAQEGRARLDQAQAIRRGDGLLRELGVAVLAERTGRGNADGQARIDQLITEISAYERDNGLDLVSPAQPGFPTSGPGPFAGPQPGPFAGPQPGPFAGPEPGSAPTGGADPFSGTGSSSFPGSGSASAPDPASPSHGGADGVPTVDTTTNFFPAPDDDQSGTS